MKQRKKWARNQVIAGRELSMYMVRKHELDSKLIEIVSEEAETKKPAKSLSKKSFGTGSKNVSVQLKLAAARKTGAPVARKTAKVAPKVQPKRSAAAKRPKLKSVTKQVQSPRPARVMECVLRSSSLPRTEK